MTKKNAQIKYWSNLVDTFKHDLPEWRIERIVRMIWEDGLRHGKPKRKRNASNRK